MAKRRKKSSMRGISQATIDSHMEKYAKRNPPHRSVGAPMMPKVEFYDTSDGGADIETPHGIVHVSGAVRVIVPTPEYDAVAWYVFGSTEAAWEEFISGVREFYPRVADSLPEWCPYC